MPIQCVKDSVKFEKGKVNGAFYYVPIFKKSKCYAHMLIYNQKVSNDKHSKVYQEIATLCCYSS